MQMRNKKEIPCFSNIFPDFVFFGFLMCTCVLLVLFLCFFSPLFDCFVLPWFVLLVAYLFSKKKGGMALHKWGWGKDLGEDEERETSD